MEQKNIIFLTFTFNDKVYKKTSAKTQERYIKAFLNEQANEYILNCDYGIQTEREHYHAIINPIDQINGVNFNAYKYGQINGKFISKYKASKQDLINYLINHCFKDTTKQSRIIFSRALKTNHLSALNQYERLSAIITLDQYKKLAKIKQILSPYQKYKLSNSQAITKLINCYQIKDNKNFNFELINNEIITLKNINNLKIKELNIKLSKINFDKLSNITNQLSTNYKSINKGQVIEHLIINFNLT